MRSEGVTVLMPVYNAQKYVSYSIEALLNQDFDNFQILIVDDACTDDSISVIESFGSDKIKIIHNDVNRNVAYSLNRGLDLIDTKYIMRADADDILHKSWIKIMYEYMERNPETAVAGTEWVYIREDTKINNNWRLPNLSDFMIMDSEQIRYRYLFYPCIHHASLIMRNSVIQDKGYRYDETVGNAEDFELIRRIVLEEETAVLKLPLLAYRRHSEAVSKNVVNDRARIMGNVVRKSLAMYDINISQETAELFIKISLTEAPFTMKREDFDTLQEVFDEQIYRNKKLAPKINPYLCNESIARAKKRFEEVNGLCNRDEFI